MLSPIKSIQFIQTDVQISLHCLLLKMYINFKSRQLSPNLLYNDMSFIFQRHFLNNRTIGVFVALVLQL